MAKKLRKALALLFFVCITFLFLDFTGTIHSYLGWMAKLQLLPAIMALNGGVLFFLALLTFFLGRIYCSTICPLGVFQDIANWFGNKRKKMRFKYKVGYQKIRLVILILFVVAMALGLSVAVVIAPYSAYGRMVTYLFSPLYKIGNNILAYFAERLDSYLFYEVDVWVKGFGSLILALATFLIIGCVAFFKGRAYCNTVCPVGTLLGFVSRFSIFKPTIEKSKCIKCKKCERNCKSSCIDIANGKIDYSRCVSCYDCVGNCPKDAIKIRNSWKMNKKISRTNFLMKKEINENLFTTNNDVLVGGDNTFSATNNDALNDNKNKNTLKNDVEISRPINLSRRKFLGVASILAAGAFAHVKAEDNEEYGAEGGLAPIADKLPPNRITRIAPPGAKSVKHLLDHCTGCGLCISVCPNNVLRPGKLAKPEAGYEKGYCRPECNRCSTVCPAGAILPITLAQKSSTQIGNAFWIFDKCIVTTDGVECGNCERHCPTGAIQMVGPDPEHPELHKVPVVNVERCIGCGACENVCPARPYSAIYVEGLEIHREI